VCLCGVGLVRKRDCVSAAGLVVRSCGAVFRASGRGHGSELVGCNHSGVYFRTWFVLGVDPISLLRHVKPRSWLEVQILQGAADLAQGCGADMRVYFDRLSGTISVVLLELCPNRV